VSALVSNAARVHRIPTYVRDDRETPLRVGRDGERCRRDLGQMGIGIFLQRGLDDPNQIDPVQQITLSAQGSLAQRIAPMGARRQASTNRDRDI
jgi:hypothetical protein